MTGRGSRPYAVLGDPVAHSLSPVMQGAAFRALGFRAEYRAIRVPAGRPDLVGSEMRALAAAGGGGNVTLPHKAAAAAALDAPGPDVTSTGACNCFWGDARGRLAGANTDVGGIVRTLAEFPGLRLEGARVLVIGAGGAARAAVVACARGGAGRIEVWNRTRSRADALVQDLGGGRVEATGMPKMVLAPPGGTEGVVDLVIQATSLGLSPDDPLPPARVRGRIGHALDLAYAPGGTPWVRALRESGVPTLDGIRLLLHQGVLSLEHWTGAPPGPEVAVAMEAALREATS